MIARVLGGGQLNHTVWKIGVYTTASKRNSGPRCKKIQTLPKLFELVTAFGLLQ